MLELNLIPFELSILARRLLDRFNRERLGSFHGSLSYQCKVCTDLANQGINSEPI